KTALIQLAAEELGVAPNRIALVTADTSRTADEGYTAGSHSMQDSGTAIRNAAAQVREILIARAAERWSMSPDGLKVADAGVESNDGKRIAYRDLVADNVTHVSAQAQSKLKPAAEYAIVGQSMQRIDIPGKVTGGIAYVQDLRFQGMVHARVVRPPSYGARVSEVRTDEVLKLPGVV